MAASNRCYNYLVVGAGSLALAVTHRLLASTLTACVIHHQLQPPPSSPSPSTSTSSAQYIPVVSDLNSREGTATIIDKVSSVAHTLHGLFYLQG
jgi:hypothetical protein